MKVLSFLKTHCLNTFVFRNCVIVLYKIIRPVVMCRVAPAFLFFTLEKIYLQVLQIKS